MINDTLKAINGLFERFLRCTLAECQTLPQIPYDQSWLSPCLQGTENVAEGEKIDWQPLQEPHYGDLSGLENAMECDLHPSLRAFFGGVYSEHLHATYQGNTLTLLFVWNDEDLNQLVENQLGHILLKTRAKLPLTLFIACTDDNRIIAIENSTGHVVLEDPGQPAEQVLADSLSDFLDALQPLPACQNNE